MNLLESANPASEEIEEENHSGRVRWHPDGPQVEPDRSREGVASPAAREIGAFPNLGSAGTGFIPGVEVKNTGFYINSPSSL